MDANLTPSEEQKKGAQQAAQQQFKSGTNWFYFIAGLSIVNSLIIAFGGDLYFVVGLGVNHLITGIIYGVAGVDFSLIPIGIRLAVLFITTIISSIFFLFGYFANKKYAWAFITGMIFYALDGLIFLMINDFFSIAFHALAIFFIFRGYLASQNLKKLEIESSIAQAGLAQPIK